MYCLRHARENCILLYLYVGLCSTHASFEQGRGPYRATRDMTGVNFMVVWEISFKRVDGKNLL